MTAQALHELFALLGSLLFSPVDAFTAEPREERRWLQAGIGLLVIVGLFWLLA